MPTRFSTNVIKKAAEGRTTILDAGCGIGAQALYLARENSGRLVSGYDMSPESVSKAKRYKERLAVPNVFFMVGTHDEFQSDYSPDMIYTSESLVGEHEGTSYFAGDEELVRRRILKFRNTLAPSGIYVITWCANMYAGKKFIGVAESCGFRLSRAVTGACPYIEFMQDPMFQTGMIFEAV